MKSLKNNQNAIMFIRISDIMKLRYKVQQNNEYSNEKSINFIVANHLANKYGFYHKEIMWAINNYETIETERKFYAIKPTLINKLTTGTFAEFSTAIREIKNNSEISFNELYARKSKLISVNRMHDRFKRKHKILVTVIKATLHDIIFDYFDVKYIHAKNDSNIIPRKGEQIYVIRCGYSLYCFNIDRGKSEYYDDDLIKKYSK